MCWIHLFASVFLVQLCSAQSQGPDLASLKYVASNPTQTTIILVKPLCQFNQAGFVYLFAAQSSVTNLTINNTENAVLKNTFATTNGGASGPYQVAKFAVPPCSDGFSLQSAQDLTPYLIRVGENTTCLNDPNFSELCNPPLQSGKKYVFKYVLEDATTKKVTDQSAWSQAITTRTGLDRESIDTWPGRRSGAMVVITSILSVLLFFLLAAFVAALVSNLMTEPSGIETTRHDTHSAKNVTQKPQASMEPTEGPRYAASS